MNIETLRRSKARRLARLNAVVGGIFVLHMCPVATAQDATALVQRGQTVVTRSCGACHAVGRSGASRHREAPALRTLARRYPIESLEEALAEGIVTGHPDMPELKFEPSDVGAIVAYLKSIQE
jgi:mono/diheme cytochrome c family protein